MSKIDLPKFTIRQLLEAGVHFGHKTMRRNPKMSRYIHTSRNGISIIDLNKTANSLHKALTVVKEIAKNNGRILFVATKKQAIEPVAEAAKRCGQYYVNNRWIGGMLTNWKTISQSIKTLKKIEEQLSDTEVGYNKKEKLVLERKRQKLEDALGGIKNMGGYPDVVFVIDTNKESLAIAEAKKLKVPIMAILDTNCNPDDISYPIPGNDDSAKSIKLYCHLISEAVIAGIKEQMISAGIDVNKFENSQGFNVEAFKNSVNTSEKSEKKSFNKESKKDFSSEVKSNKKEIVRKSDDSEEASLEEKSENKGTVKLAKKPAAKAGADKKPAAKKPAAKKPAAKK